jgi:hypothetical protein
VINLTEKVNAQITNTLLENVMEPRTPVMTAVYKAFQKMNFQCPISEWLIPDDRKEDFFALGSAPLMRVVAHRSGGYELVGGFRTFVLAQACAIKRINVIVLDGLDAVSLLDFAIRDCLFFITMSCVKGSVATHSQIEVFINAVRKEIPAELVKLLPSKNDVRTWLSLNLQSNRKLKELISPLETLKQRADQAIADDEELRQEKLDKERAEREERRKELASQALLEQTKRPNESNAFTLATSTKAERKRTNRALAKQKKMLEKQRMATTKLPEGKAAIALSNTIELDQAGLLADTKYESVQTPSVQGQELPPFPKWNEICR